MRAAGRRAAHNSGLTVLPSGYSACRTHGPVAKRLSIIFSCGLLVAACGSSGKQPSSENTGYSQALAFAKCMRSHGASDFPDPGASGGISMAPGSGISSAAPAFQAAQRSCRHLLPGGGSLSGPPNPQAKAQVLKMSKCMRAHEIPSFPDPHSGPPPGQPVGYRDIIATNGFWLGIPASINTQSPGFKRAAAACNFGPTGV